MATFTFQLPDPVASSAATAQLAATLVATPDSSRIFEVKGPQGMTLDQARAILEQQFKTGSLVGFRAGNVLTAATQAANGLVSAAAPLLQQVSGVASTLTSLQPANIVSQLATRNVSSLPNLASFADSAAKSAASVALKINATAVTDPVTVGEYAKAVTALPSQISNFTTTQMSAAMAGVQKELGQTLTSVTENGIGKYALDATQLEQAGYLKPGTFEKYLAGGKNPLADVLSSASVWTGKDGIRNMQGLLGNGALQTKIQQTLMTEGVQQIKQLGVNIANMASNAVGAVASVAAKGVAQAAAWIKNSPLVSGVSTVLNKLGSAASFAVNLVGSLFGGGSEKRIKIPVPAVNTINRATVNAAAVRLLNNSKIPNPLPRENNSSALAVDIVSRFADNTVATFVSIEDRLRVYRDTGNVTPEELVALQQEFLSTTYDFGGRFDTLSSIAQSVLERDQNTGLVSSLTQSRSSADAEIARLRESIARLFAEVQQIVLRNAGDVFRA